EDKSRDISKLLQIKKTCRLTKVISNTSVSTCNKTTGSINYIGSQS
ncbi:15871_t:CDS:1, partial [Rhizophagus irregularis]